MHIDGVPPANRESLLMAIEMRCPGCGTRSFYAHIREPDDVLRCGNCRHEFEFRQFRETACSSHRDELLEACPELARAFSQYLIGEPRGTGETSSGVEPDDDQREMRHALWQWSH